MIPAPVQLDWTCRVYSTPTDIAGRGVVSEARQHHMPSRYMRQMMTAIYRLWLIVALGWASNTNN